MMTPPSVADSSTSKPTLTERLRVVENELRSAAHQAAAQVSNNPDNPSIKKLGTHVFIAKSSNLQNNWSPEFHDWKWQFEFVADLLKKQHFAAVRVILETGKHRANGVNQAFAEEVLKRIRDVVGDLVMPEMNASEPPVAIARRAMKP